MTTGSKNRSIVITRKGHNILHAIDFGTYVPITTAEAQRRAAKRGRRTQRSQRIARK
jgi:hypothetical protein